MDEMYALADAYGMRLREVPIPPEAYAFMADVLANTTSTQEGDGQHDTSLGTHNSATWRQAAQRDLTSGQHDRGAHGAEGG